MAAAPLIVSDTFAHAFGDRRGDAGRADALAGNDSPAARRYITGVARSEDFEEMLALLRESDHRGGGALLREVRAAITDYAVALACSPSWQTRCQEFLAECGLLRPSASAPTVSGFLADCGLLGEGAPTDIRRLLDATGGVAFYTELLIQTLASDLTGDRLALLHTRADIEGWMVAGAVQEVLSALALRGLHSPAGEKALERHLSNFTYETLLADAEKVGVSRLHELLDDEDDLLEDLRPLLPNAPHERTPHKVLEHFNAFGYQRAIARGIDRRAAKLRDAAD